MGWHGVGGPDPPADIMSPTANPQDRVSPDSASLPIPHPAHADITDHTVSPTHLGNLGIEGIGSCLPLGSRPGTGVRCFPTLQPWFGGGRLSQVGLGSSPRAAFCTKSSLPVELA